MKRFINLLLVVTVVFTLAACTNTNTSNNVDNQQLTSKESLATLSYLSGGLLDTSLITTLNNGLYFNSPKVVKLTDSGVEDGETEIESELNQVNIYVDRLKTFIDNGTESFGNVKEEVSDNELYSHKLTFTVNEEDYVIYYNVDDLTAEITGIFLIGDVEYTIEASNTLFDKEELDDEDEEESDKKDEEDSDKEDEVDDEESEQKMVLTATNGSDTIKITYKVESEEEESTTKFEMKSNINGTEKVVFLKISHEEDEHKIDVIDGDAKYTFKRELEEEGTVYKLEYEVNGVNGQVKIIETVNEAGEVVYEYKVSEGDTEKEFEKSKPSSKGRDEDDEESEEV